MSHAVKKKLPPHIVALVNKNNETTGIKLKRRLTYNECKHIMGNILGFEIYNLSYYNGGAYGREEYDEYQSDLVRDLHEWFDGKSSDANLADVYGESCNHQLGLFNLIPIITYLQKKGVI